MYFLFGSVLLFAATNGQTESCPNSGLSSCVCDPQTSGNSCTLNCDGVKACQDATLTCRDGDDCTLFCSKKDACNGASLTCPSGAACTVQCPSGNSVCLNLAINLNGATSFQCTGNCPATPAPPTTAPPTTPSPTDPPVTAQPTASPVVPTPAPTTPTQSPSAPTTPTTPTCDRHREPWHLLSQSDRDLYINGFKTLASNGKLAYFTQTHASNAIHNASPFLPWHRYFIYELETQIRNLGGAYSCFALPYWDWTKDIEDNQFNMQSYAVLSTGLSGDSGGECVTGNFAPSEYTPYSTMASGGNWAGNCLRRNVCNPQTDANGCNYGGSSAAQLMSSLTQYSNYGDDSNGGTDYGYSDDLEGPPHAWAHNFMGGNTVRVKGTTYRMQLSNLLYSPDDPFFYLLHAMVDYQYTLWQDCRNHEQTDKTQITTDMYGEASNLDLSMSFTPLSNQGWSLASTLGTISPREMFNNLDWAVSYDQGDFFTRANVDSNLVCQGNIHPNLFKDITLRRRRRLGVADPARSDYGQYTATLFKGLQAKLTNPAFSRDKGVVTKDNNRKLFKTWAQMDCEYLQMDNPCERPKYFDDCSNMLRTRPVSYGVMTYDIDITLAEMTEKVKDYPCMVATREALYDWAYASGKLYSLCRGVFDRFCDRTFEQERQDTCARAIENRANSP